MNIDFLMRFLCVTFRNYFIIIHLPSGTSFSSRFPSEEIKKVLVIFYNSKHKRRQNKLIILVLAIFKRLSADVKHSRSAFFTFFVMFIVLAKSSRPKGKRRKRSSKSPLSSPACFFVILLQRIVRAILILSCIFTTYC